MIGIIFHNNLKDHTVSLKICKGIILIRIILILINTYTLRSLNLVEIGLRYKQPYCRIVFILIIIYALSYEMVSRFLLIQDHILKT